METSGGVDARLVDPDDGQALKMQTKVDAYCTVSCVPLTSYFYDANLIHIPTIKIEKLWSSDV